jgi:uncharacterized protein YecE (DUF72 family)
VYYPSFVGEIRVGTSGWNYPTGAGTWNGIFYPARRPRSFDELAYYAEHFDTVEVNSSFYRMPEPAVTTRWAQRTPASFLFAVKLYQKFTHPDMFLAREGVKDWDLSRADFDLFRAGVAPLFDAGRLAAVLAQFPPSFHADADARAYLAWLLGGLIAYPVAVELRHRSWSDDAEGTSALLQEYGAAWALIDEPKFRSSVRQNERVTLAGQAPLAYIRMHGRNAAAWWEHDTPDDRYDYLYSHDELKPFAEAAEEAAKTRKRVLVYFNNHFSAKAVANAAVLKHDLGQILPGSYTEEMVERYPELEAIASRERRLL